MKRMLMIILKVVFMLHFERVHGFMLKVQNSLISNRVIRIKTINKSFNRQLHLCNDSFTDESTGTRSNELGGTERDGPSMKALEEAQEGAPDEFVIMKELLGINIFTYILAGLIALFLSLNILLGPGWLGQSMGLEGTGTFTEVSDSLPKTVDLSASENLL